MKKQEHREVLPPAPGHTAGMWFQPGLKAKFITHPAILLHHVLPSVYILPLHKGGTTLRYRSGIYELILLFKSTRYLHAPPNLLSIYPLFFVPEELKQ